MTRIELGIKLLEWHGGQTDPVYAVGSYYFSGHVYPQKGIANDAVWNLEKELSQCRRMARGEVVLVRRNGHEVSLKAFAGYKRRELRERIRELLPIVDALKAQISEDYPADYEQCGDCGFDHDYEPTQATAWHTKNPGSYE